MPGAMFLHDQPTYQGVPGQGMPDATAAGLPAGPSALGVIVWLAIIGVVVPAFILGGLKVAGLQFVFRAR